MEQGNHSTKPGPDSQNVFFGSTTSGGDVFGTVGGGEMGGCRVGSVSWDATSCCSGSEGAPAGLELTGLELTPGEARVGVELPGAGLVFSGS